jgi:hypothetical protein
LTPNEIGIAWIFLITLLLSFLAFRNSRTEKQNVELFSTTGEIMPPMWIFVLLFILTTGADMVAIGCNHHSIKDDSWVLAVIGMLAMFFVFISSLFQIRFESDSFRFGLKHRHSVNYSEIIELKRNSRGKDVDFSLVLRSGETTQFGSNLSCEKLVLDELQKRSNCKITRLRFGSHESDN